MLLFKDGNLTIRKKTLNIGYGVIAYIKTAF